MLGEFDIIRRYFTRPSAGRADVVLGVGDDAALLTPPDGELVVAVDALVEDVHFPHGTPARAIGHRALAVNLSDLAAMGASPLWATLALSLPSADETWLADFAAGFFELAEQHGVSLVGGDTVRGPLQVTVQAIGSVPRGAALRRDGGRTGDDIYVSGNLGDAAAGLRVLGSNGASERLAQRFLYPQPRVELGTALRGWASAAIDISDGLAVDVMRLAQASGCGAELDVSRLPFSREVRRSYVQAERRYLALSGGDDYELCFAVPQARRAQFEAFCQTAGHTALRVGHLCDGETLVLKDEGKVINLSTSGYDHFHEDS